MRAQGISELVLVSVEKKKIYAHSEFQDVQAAHHASVREKLVSAVEEVKEIMGTIYKVCVAPCITSTTPA